MESYQCVYRFNFSKSSCVMYAWGYMSVLKGSHSPGDHRDDMVVFVQCEEEEQTGFIKYDRFEPMMARVLLAQRHVCPSPSV